jgi:hypothetical protein
MGPTGDRPDCECHDTPMMWDPDPRRKSGGYWRCVVKYRDRKRAWEHTEAGRRRKREQAKRRRERRIAAGLCAQCAEPSLSRWYCWEHLNQKEEQSALAL